MTNEPLAAAELPLPHESSGDGPLSASSPTVASCPRCGRDAGDGGECKTCGTTAMNVRDHYCESPSSWVAACCDRGIRHDRNEDATAVASEPRLGARAVLVVLDGVSTSLDSDVASLAGAHAARDALVAQPPAGAGSMAMLAALEEATRRANAAIIATTAPDSENAASCTFAAALTEGDLAVFGNVGDSRVYWVPDPGQPDPPRALSVDDSVAQFRMSAGVPRTEAENGPQAHAITKWLGRDSPDTTPRTGSITMASSGWLVVCSDGLWNYVSEADKLQKLLARLSDGSSNPLRLATSLVRWANEQGGRDNISVALARHLSR